MKAATTILTVMVLLIGPAHLTASGPLGIYGIVEKVVFEPDDKSPERIQVWGAFAYVDGRATSPLAVSAPKRGYLYFKLPPLTPGFTNQSHVAIVKTEWADLKAVAGTGQVIGFGSWSYVGDFDGLQPDTRGTRPPYILERAPRGGAQTDLRVRPASEAPRLPATYQTNAGIVKLTDRGSHAAIVKQLKETLAGTDFRLDIGRSIAGNAPNIKNAVLVIRPLACSDSTGFHLTGTAEGIVNGTRHSVPLKLIPLDRPGTHAVGQQWPDGRWVLNFVGTCRGETAGALVPLGKKGFLRESSKFLSHAATATEIDASLSALASGGSR